MAITANNRVALREVATDSDAVSYKPIEFRVKFDFFTGDECTGVIQVHDSDGNRVGFEAYVLTQSELVAEEAGFVAALATVRDAVEKAIITRLEAISANSGVTFTHT